MGDNRVDPCLRFTWEARFELTTGAFGVRRQSAATTALWPPSARNALLTDFGDSSHAKRCRARDRVLACEKARGMWPQPSGSAGSTRALRQERRPGALASN